MLSPPISTIITGNHSVSLTLPRAPIEDPWLGQDKELFPRLTYSHSQTLLSGLIYES